MAVTYAKETKQTPIKTIIINPGPLRTAMRAKAVPGEDPTSLKTPADIAPHLVELSVADLQRSGVLWDFPTKCFVDI